MNEGYPPDITNPDITLPPLERHEGNPLEALLEQDEKIEGIRHNLVGKVVEYGGLRLRVENVEYDLSLIGKQVDGGEHEANIVIKREDIRSFRIVG